MMKDFRDQLDDDYMALDLAKKLMEDLFKTVDRNLDVATVGMTPGSPEWVRMCYMLAFSSTAQASKVGYDLFQHERISGFEKPWSEADACTAIILVPLIFYFHRHNNLEHAIILAKQIAEIIRKGEKT